MGDRHIPTFSLNPESIEGSREKEIFSLAPNPKTLEGLREPFEGLRAEGRPAVSDLRESNPVRCSLPCFLGGGQVSAEEAIQTNQQTAVF